MKIKNSKHIANRSYFRMTIIAVAVFVLAIMAFFILIPRNDSNSGGTIILPKDAASAKTIVKEETTVSEDSIRYERDSIRLERKRDLERMREG